MARRLEDIRIREGGRAMEVRRRAILTFRIGLVDRLILAIALPVFAFLGPLAADQSPVLTHITPHALIPGRTSAVTLHGRNLQGFSKLWTSFDPRTECLSSESKCVTFRVTVPADPGPGPGGAWLATTNGVSNLLPIAYDDLPAINATTNNLGTNAPILDLPIPVAVDGFCRAGQIERFKLPVKSGQSVGLEVLAARLGSPLDPLLRLLDASGRELALVDDSTETGADPRMEHRFDHDTTCIIEVRDARWKGGEDYRFRLRAAFAPLSHVRFPLTANGTGVSTRGATDATHDPHPVGREVQEVEPNDDPAHATPFAVPCTLNGQFAVSGDTDQFLVHVRKGERWIFIGETRQAGSPADLAMRVEGRDGTVLAESDGATARDVVLDVRFNRDEPVRVLVYDLLGRGGPGFPYRLRVEPFAPGFTLQVETNRLNPPRGGVFTLKVTAHRRGFDGPITLALGEAAAKFTLASNVIAQGKSETTLRTELPAELAEGTLLVWKVTGSANVQGRDVTVTAGSRDALEHDWPTIPFPPSALDGLVALGVGPALPDFFRLELMTNVVRFPAAGGKAAFTVRVKPLDKAFTSRVDLSFERLPAGLATKVIPDPAGGTDYQVELTGGAGLTPLAGDFGIIAMGTFRDQTRRLMLAKVPFRLDP